MTDKKCDPGIKIHIEVVERVDKKRYFLFRSRFLHGNQLHEVNRIKNHYFSFSVAILHESQRHEADRLQTLPTFVTTLMITIYPPFYPIISERIPIFTQIYTAYSLPMTLMMGSGEMTSVQGGLADTTASCSTVRRHHRFRINKGGRS